MTRKELHVPKTFVLILNWSLWFEYNYFNYLKVKFIICFVEYPTSYTEKKLQNHKNCWISEVYRFYVP